MAMRITVADIVGRLGGECRGDATLAIDRIAPLDRAQASHISFLAHPRYRAQLDSSAAGCVIVAPAFADQAAARGTVIVTPDPYLYYARLSQWWAEQASPIEAGVHPSAVVDAGAVLGPGVSVGPLCHVG